MVVGKPFPQIPKESLVFLKGEPTPLPVPGHPCIVELWATWCGPCRMVFPHLSDTQRKYRDKGLVVVGVSVEEDSPQIRNFVAQQGDKMDYTVAVSSAVGGQLMNMAQVSGIPHAFVVDKAGVIRYSGHPMDPRFGQELQKVVAEGPQEAPKQEKAMGPVTESREELLAKPVKELKKILEDRNIGYGDLNEKPEYVDRILDRCSKVTYYA